MTRTPHPDQDPHENTRRPLKKKFKNEYHNDAELTGSQTQVAAPTTIDEDFHNSSRLLFGRLLQFSIGLLLLLPLTL
jgi:hypothetical protein